MALNKRSRVITEGDARSANRAMLYPVGFTAADFSKPIVGIAHGHSTMNPCNAGIGSLVDRAVAAVKAAGAIHSDFEKKFIRAEVVNWQALIDHNGYPGVREKGMLRLEGKEYIVKDGDVLVIRHG